MSERGSNKFTKEPTASLFAYLCSPAYFCKAEADQAGKDLDREDRRSNSVITRDPATRLGGSGPGDQGARAAQASGGSTSEASAGCQREHQASAGPKGGGGEVAKRVGRSTDFVCQEHGF